MRHHRQPQPDRYTVLYAGIIGAGFTLHIDGDHLRIAPAEHVTPALQAHVKRHEAGLMAHLRRIDMLEDRLLGKRLDEVKPLAF